MAKKKAPQGPGPQQLQIYQRMNFLYQAATLMSSLARPIPPTSTSPPKKHIKQKCSKTDIKWQASQDLHPLARYYNTNMKKIGRRLVIRVDPHIKRSICKRCDTPLLPVTTSTTRSKSKPEPAIVNLCHACGSQRSYLLKEDHTLCIDRPDRLLQPPQDDVDLLPTKGQPEVSSVQQQQGM
ncbi:Rpr2-domain-containing protein [Hesseltinella vesiculosa]|uniref:Rpr2-domain-containing protein n=1 Tax=Hesseltinella vesiculosa TaxID=101127 RepID=A0A1X2G4Z5_9FUNG|nr:Rpr2-domain-containing protein [Hesseltinella vesiculosa]